MMTDQTATKLTDMKLHGMAAAYERQRGDPTSADLSFDERFAMLVDGEWHHQRDRALQRRLNYAKLKQNACIEDIDWRVERGLERAVIDQLSTSQWVRYGQHCIITGATGMGKSWLACALAQKACRDGFRARYAYSPRLFREMLAAEVDGTFTRLVRRLGRIDLLLVDDLLLESVKPAQYRAFLELLDERHGTRSVLITTQYPVPQWHERIGDPTVADAICDRLVHNAYSIRLKGEKSMRELRNRASPQPA
jgi:DNA replication protein DnaC